MSQLRTISALIFLVKVACFWRDVSGVPAILGDSVNLTATLQCKDGKALGVTRLLKNAKPVLVLKEGVPEEDYRHRVENISTTSVVLNNVNYNDAGVYEFTCGGSMVTIKLDVFAPSEVLVAEGDEGKLPYYFLTAGEVNVRFIRWEKNSELVCELDLSSHEVTYGTKFNGKVSVSPDWFKQGDLSLNLKRAEPQDEGVFFINHEDKVKMEAAAVKVRVQKRKSGVVASTSLPECPPLTTIVCITVAVTSAVVALLAGCCCFGWCMKSRKTSGRAKSPHLQNGIEAEFK